MKLRRKDESFQLNKPALNQAGGVYVNGVAQKFIVCIAGIQDVELDIQGNMIQVNHATIIHWLTLFL